MPATRRSEDLNPRAARAARAMVPSLVFKQAAGEGRIAVLWVGPCSGDVALSLIPAEPAQRLADPDDFMTP